MSDCDIQLTSSTPSGVRFNLVEGYPKLSYSRDGVNAQEKYIIEYAQLDLFVDECFPEITVRALRNRVRKKYYFPGKPWLTVDTIDVGPWPETLVGGGDTSVKQAKYAVIDISYTPKDDEANDPEPDETQPSTFLTHSVGIGVEYLTLPTINSYTPTNDPSRNASPSDAKYGNLNTFMAGAQDEVVKGEIPMIKRIPTIEHTFTWKEVLRPDWQSIINAVGMTNDAKFLGSDSGGVMFMGVDAHREFTPRGALPWQVTFRFSQRMLKNQFGAELGWNHFYLPDKGDWSLVWKKDDAGTKTLIYPTTDFRLIFKARQEVASIFDLPRVN